jgi:hypothetical protein
VIRESPRSRRLTHVPPVDLARAILLE